MSKDVCSAPLFVWRRNQRSGSGRGRRTSRTGGRSEICEGMDGDFGRGPWSHVFGRGIYGNGDETVLARV